jgi:transposase
MAHPIELRKLAIKMNNEGRPKSEIAKIIGTRSKVIRDWIKLYAETGSLEKKAYRNGVKQSCVDGTELKNYVDENPSKTQNEMGVVFGVSGRTIGIRLKQIGYTYKKKVG